MGNIPEYKSQSPFQAPVNKALFSEAEFTENIGQGIGNLGANAADFIFKAQMREEALQADLYQKEVGLELDSFVNAETDRITKEFAQNPDKAPDAFKQSYSKKVDELAKKAPFPREKERFSFIAKDMEIKVVDNIARWGHTQQIKKLVELTDDYSKAQNTAIYRTPLLEDPKTGTLTVNKELLDSTLAAQSVYANDFEQTMDPLLVQSKNKEYRKGAVLAMFNGINDQAIAAAKRGDAKRANALYAKAKEMIDSEDYDYDLGQDGVQSVNRALRFIKEKKDGVAKDFSKLKLSDPHEYLRRMGRPLPPVDINNPDTVIARYQARPEYEKRDGLVLPLLSPYEAGLWSANFDRAEGGKRKEMLSTFRSYPDPIASELMQQLFPDRPEFAAAVRGMQLGSAEAQKVTDQIIESSDFLRKNKDTKAFSNTMPEKAASMAFADTLIKDTARDSYSKQAVYDAGMAAVIADRRKNGRSGKVFTSQDKKAFKSAVDALGMTPFDFGKSRIRRPFDQRTGKFADDSRMRALRDSITNENLEAAFGSKVYNRSGKVFDIVPGDKRLIFDPVPGGAGYYIYFAGDNLLDKDGKPYIINFDKLNQLPQVKERTFTDKLKDMFGGGR